MNNNLNLNLNLNFNAMNNTESKALTLDEIKSLAPSAFCEAPTAKVSARYKVALTIPIIEDMASMGWYVHDASEPRKRKSIYGRTNSRHFLIFRNDAYSIVDKQGHKFPAEVILDNSHDGAHAFRFRLSIYNSRDCMRYVYATDEFVNLAIRHINYTMDELRNVVMRVVDTIPAMAEMVSRMVSRTLTDDEKFLLVEKCVNERRASHPDYDSSVIFDVLDKLEESSSDNLWEFFVNLQACMIEGGFCLPDKKGKLRKVRGIKSLASMLAYNQKMFAFAKELVC